MSLREDGGKTLITPSGGSGGSTTIDAPLGSRPAADSVSVAIASDQLPLPVTATLDTTLLAKEAKQDTEITRLTSILGQLDVALSTRASQVTLASILAQLDVALSTRSSEATLVTVLARLTLILAQLDVALSTRASETTLSTRGSEATLLNVLTTAAFQARINTLGQKLMAASTPVVIASDQSAIPVSGTVSVNEPVTVDAVNLDIRDLAFATDKVDVSGSTVTATAQPGVDIGDVTINNGAGASAVNIQDGGNVITTDGSLTNNSAIPAANNVGVLPAIANSSNPTYTSGRQVLLSTNLAGYTRAILPADEGQVVTATTRPNRQFNSGALTNPGDTLSFSSLDGRFGTLTFQLTAPYTNVEIDIVATVGGFQLPNLPLISLDNSIFGLTTGKISASSSSEAKILTTACAGVDSVQIRLISNDGSGVFVQAFVTTSPFSMPIWDQSPDGRIKTLAGGFVSNVPEPYTSNKSGSLSLTNIGNLRVEDTKQTQFNSTTMTEVLKEIRNEMRINNYLLRIGFEGKLGELRLFDDTASFDSIAGGQPNIVRMDDFTQN